MLCSAPGAAGLSMARVAEGVSPARLCHSAQLGAALMRLSTASSRKAKPREQRGHEIGRGEMGEKKRADWQRLLAQPASFTETEMGQARINHSIVHFHFLRDVVKGVKRLRNHRLQLIAIHPVTRKTVDRQPPTAVTKSSHA